MAATSVGGKVKGVALRTWPCSYDSQRGTDCEFVPGRRENSESQELQFICHV